MTDQQHEVIVMAVRALFLLGLPVVVATAISGIVVSVLQAATTVTEPAVNYAIRLVAVVLVVTFTLTFAEDSLRELFEIALG